MDKTVNILAITASIIISALPMAVEGSGLTLRKTPSEPVAAQPGLV